MRLTLSQPYPFYYKPGSQARNVALVLVAAVSLFMVLFTPFTITYEEHRFPYWLIAIIFGVVDGVVFYGFTLGLEKVFLGDNKTNWTIAKELAFWSVVLLGIGIANFLLREVIYINPNNFSVAYLLEEIAHSYLFGLLAISLITFGNFSYLVVTKTKESGDWGKMIQEINDSLESPEPIPVTIDAASEQDIISFNLSDFIYARADGNYVEFIFRNEQGDVERQIKRNTLKNVEQQLEPFDHVMRVHRSYLVNCTHVVGVEGNSQGKNLTFPGVEEKVSVSRNYIPSFDAVMNG